MARPQPLLSGASATADSAGTVTQNPAGMARFDEFQMRLDLYVLDSESTWEQEFGDTSFATTTETESDLVVPNLSLVAPLSEDWYFGFGMLGYSVSDDYGDDWGDPVKASLSELHALYKARRKQREKRGAIDFDSTEVGFKFDESGEVLAVEPRTRNDAHMLIEECMIAANVEAAKFVGKQKTPALFRVHPAPPEQKVLDMVDALAPLGLHLPSHEHLQPRDVAKVLEVDASVSVSGSVVGTPAFMAPEQASGDREIGPRTDVYGLGATLYACLSGRPPFEERDVVKLLKQVAEEEPAPAVHP